MYIRKEIIMRALKLGAIMIIAAAVCAAAVSLPKRTAFESGANYTFYIGSSSSDCKVLTVERNAGLVLLTLSNVCGEATTFSELDIESFLAGVDGEILFEERLSDSVNYYCSADLPYSAELYGRTVNLHICVREGGTTVASPIIFGGY